MSEHRSPMAGGDTAGQHHPYTILTQSHGEDLNAAGVFVETWTYTAQGPDGTTVQVKMPATQVTPAAVDAAIQAKLDLVHEVGQLGPQPHPDNAL